MKMKIPEDTLVHTQGELCGPGFGSKTPGGIQLYGESGTAGKKTPRGAGILSAGRRGSQVKSILDLT